MGMNTDEKNANVEKENLSYGGRMVGLSFNPDQNPDVGNVKATYAELIDFLNAQREQAEDPEKKRLCSIAITEAQAAQMWAVKAVTWGL